MRPAEIELISAYLDGELDGPEKEACEALLKRSDEARQLLEELGADGNVLRGALGEPALDPVRAGANLRRFMAGLPEEGPGWIERLLEVTLPGLVLVGAVGLAVAVISPVGQGLEPSRGGAEPTRVVAVVTEPPEAFQPPDRPATAAPTGTPEVPEAPVPQEPPTGLEGPTPIRIAALPAEPGHGFRNVVVTGAAAATSFEVEEMEIQVLWILE